MNQKLSIQYRNVADLTPYAKNARTHDAAQVQALADGITEFGWTLPILIDGTGTIIAGHGRIMAAAKLGMDEVPTITLDHLTDAQRRAYILADNKLTERGGWDRDLLAQELADLKELGIDLELTGFESGELDDLLSIGDDPKRASLTDRFLVPPFSVLDARQAYWQQRKREWLDLGIDSEVGRGENLLKFSDTANEQGPKPRRLTYAQGSRPADQCDPTTQRILEKGSGTSIFDPVLCEIAYRWFCPPGGLILDPFAGGSVRGIVASRLGRRYIGIELRPEQIAANREQAARICRDGDPVPEWIEGDARDIKQLLPPNISADFVFSCPPYADLERYSDDPRDLSTMDYETFRAAMDQIISDSCDFLADDRFACMVVGDVRDPRGNYRGFSRHTAEGFERAGLHEYNQAILITALGSLPIRVGTQFMRSRKLGKTHQDVVVAFKGDVANFQQTYQLRTSHHNVEIFLKGDAKAATAAIGEVEIGALEQDQPESEAACLTT